MANKIALLFVLVYSIADVLLNSLVFVYLAPIPKNVTQNDIYDFQFNSSPFDLVVLSALRSCIIFGAIIGVLKNPVQGVQRMRNFQTCLLYFSCFNAIYAVLKVLYFTADTNGKSKRMWIVIGMSFAAVFLHYLSWWALGYVTEPQLKKLIVNSETGEISSENENETLTLSGDDDDDSDKKDKLNKLDKDAAKQYTTLQTVVKLIKMSKDDIAFILVAVVFLIGASVGQVFLPFYTGEVLNYIVIDRDKAKFQEAMIYMALITLAAGFAAGMRAGLFTFVFSRYILRLQKLLFSCIIRMEIAFFDVRKTGEITSRLTSDCQKIGDTVGLNLNVLSRNVVKIIGILIFMIKLSWKLSLLTLVSTPIIAIISDHFGDVYRKLSERVQNSLAEANESAEEAISCIRTVRSFAAEQHEIDRYSQRLDVTYKYRKTESFVQTFYRWSIEITDLAMSLMILYFGGHLVLLGEISGGHLVSFILYSLELGFAFDEIGDVYTGIMEAVGAARSVLVYIDRKPEILSGSFNNKEDIRGEIRFDNVSFAYPSRPDQTVLKNVNLTAKPGEIVALVGASGGGKSTIVSLLEHFYEPSQGRVLLDNVSLNSYVHEYFHGKLGLVQQEPVLFARSIADNISYGLPGITTHNDIESAAKMANADDFISSMPDKYSTQAGEKGIQLSGGQKQRVAIARALIRNPAVLILDEATSALDTESEHLVQQAINRNLKGRTVIIIAHRLSTVEKADKIYVLDRGEVVEEGTHESLLSIEGGVYSNLVKRQILGIGGDN